MRSPNTTNRRSRMRSRRSRIGFFVCAVALFLSPLFCAAQTQAPQTPATAPDLEHTKTLIAQMRAPLRAVPLNIVVEALTGHKVLPFDPANPTHAEVLKRLNAAAATVAAKIRAEGGISSKRVNEVGDAIEKYVRAALTTQGLPATVPTGEKTGRARAAGYPDVAFTYNNAHFYLDCKTHTAATESSTMRTFYLSPSDDPKISHDAVHLILSFETERAGDIYQLTRYKIVSLEKLTLDLKYEFNSDNRRMYSNKNGAQTLADAACE